MKRIFINDKGPVCHPELGSGSLTRQGENNGKRSRNEFGMTVKNFGMTAGAFTLAEVLITLAIIGVVAALTIPSVISNSQQQEFKTGLRKAVSVLNSAITMNMAIDGESPYDNANLFGYLQRHMNVMKSANVYEIATRPQTSGNTYNSVFYTVDGMRFDFLESRSADNEKPLYENPKIFVCQKSTNTWIHSVSETNAVCGGCGSYGLNNNPDKTTKPPCLVSVDVNGDRKPTPKKVYATAQDATDAYDGAPETYWVPTLESKHVSDIFVILITDEKAIPYGVVAQKAMYQAQK